MTGEKDSTRFNILTIEPTSKCVGRCIMCKNWSLSEQSSLDIDVCKNIINQAAKLGVDHINFAGGEPLLFSGLIDLIKLIKSYGIETALVTMGTLINEINAMELIKSGIDEIRFSLDSPVSDVHNEIRGTKLAFSKGVIGLRNLLDVRNKVDSNNPVVVVGMTVMKLNYQQIIEMVEFCDKIKVNRLDFNPVMQVDIKTINDTNLLFGKKVTSRQFELCETERLHLNATETNLLEKSLRMVDNNKQLTINTNARSIIQTLDKVKSRTEENYFQKKQEDQSFFCIYPYNRLIIDSVGNAFPCSPIRYLLGNVKNESLKEIWGGDIRADVIKILSEQKMPAICYSCCSFKDTYYSSYPYTRA